MKKKLSLLPIQAGMMLATLLLLTTPALAYGEYTTYTTPGSDAAGAAAFGLLSSSFWLLMCCCGFIFTFGVNVVAAVLVYKDAVKNNADNKELWAAFSLFIPLFGVLIYFLAIRPDAIRKMETAAIAEPQRNKEENAKDQSKESTSKSAKN